MAFWRRHGAAAASTAAQVAARPHAAEWKQLPALQRVVTAIEPTASRESFVATLSSHHNPEFLAPLAHVINPDGPGGQVSGLITPAPAPAAPAVQRMADGERVLIQRWAPRLRVVPMISSAGNESPPEHSHAEPAPAAVAADESHDVPIATQEIATVADTPAPVEVSAASEPPTASEASVAPLLSDAVPPSVTSHDVIAHGAATHDPVAHEPSTRHAVSPDAVTTAAANRRVPSTPTAPVQRTVLPHAADSAPVAPPIIATPAVSVPVAPPTQPTAQPTLQPAAQTTGQPTVQPTGQSTPPPVAQPAVRSVQRTDGARPDTTRVPVQRTATEMPLAQRAVPNAVPLNRAPVERAPSLLTAPPVEPVERVLPVVAAPLPAPGPAPATASSDDTVEAPVAAEVEPMVVSRTIETPAASHPAAPETRRAPASSAAPAASPSMTPPAPLSVPVQRAAAAVDIPTVTTREIPTLAAPPVQRSATGPASEHPAPRKLGFGPPLQSARPTVVEVTHEPAAITVQQWSTARATPVPPAAGTPRPATAYPAATTPLHDSSAPARAGFGAPLAASPPTAFTAVQHVQRMTTPAQAGSAIRPAPLALPARASTAPIELPLQREVEVAQTWDAGSVAVDAGVAQRSADGSVVFDVASAPAVQREADDAPAASEPAPAAAAAPSAAAPGAGGQNIDDLVRRLYDPLAARIKAELWLDRERAGLVTDLRRT